MRTPLRRAMAPLVVVVAALAWPAAALAQAAHEEGEMATFAEQSLLGASGAAHGVAQGLAVFLAGLVAFVAAVWMPASRTMGTGRDVGGLFSRVVWALFGLLVIVGVVELGLFAVRASGEPFSIALFVEALFDTRTGNTWLLRLGLGLLTALAATWAARRRRSGGWWAAAGVGGLLLLTLARQSHAATEGTLALFAAWVHVVAAAFWMGGLLGFPVLLLGSLRVMEPDERAKARRETVRRFSKVATVAVMAILVTGLYATLLNVPSISALMGSAYGRALIMKLGLIVFLLASGGINLIDRGDGPFGRMVGAELVLAIAIFVATGFLTSLPPAG